MLTICVIFEFEVGFCSKIQETTPWSTSAGLDIRQKRARTSVGGEEKDKEAYLLYQISPETHDRCTGQWQIAFG